jgi:ferredoxin
MPDGGVRVFHDPCRFHHNEELPRFYFKPLVDYVQQRMKRSFDHPASSEIKLPASVKKPSEGKVLLRGDLLAKCDPMGCKGCLQICPTGCYWVPRKAEDIAARGKITMDDDLCIHCGACHNACPHRIIEVTRTKVNHHMPADANRPWLAGWRNRIQLLLEPPEAGKPRPRLHAVEAGAGQQPPVPAPEAAIAEIPREIKEQLARDFEAVKGSLAQVNTRFWIEFKKLEPLRKALGKLLPAKK